MLLNGYYPYPFFKCINSISDYGWKDSYLFAIGYGGKALVTNFGKPKSDARLGYQVRDLYTNKLLFESNHVYDLIVVSSNSNVIAVSNHRQPNTEILEIDTGNLISEIGNFFAPPMLLMSDGKTIICADYEYEDNFATSSKNINMFDTYTGELVKTFKWYKEYSDSGYYDECLLISSDEKIMLIVSENEGIWIDSYRYFYSLWDLTTDMLVVSNETVKNWTVDSICVALDGQYLASGMRNGRLKVWDLITDKMLYSYTGNSPSVMTSEGKFLICADFKNILIYDLHTQKVICTLEGHQDKITDIVLSPDKQAIASYSIDGNIKVWSIPEKV